MLASIQQSLLISCSFRTDYWLLAQRCRGPRETHRTKEKPHLIFLLLTTALAAGPAHPLQWTTQHVYPCVRPHARCSPRIWPQNRHTTTDRNAVTLLPTSPTFLFLSLNYVLHTQTERPPGVFYSCVSLLDAIHPYLIGNIAADDSCGGGGGPSRSFAVTSTSSAFLDHDLFKYVSPRQTFLP